MEEEEEEEAVDAVDAAAMEVTVVEGAMVLSEEATKRLASLAEAQAISPAIASKAPSATTAPERVTFLRTAPSLSVRLATLADPKAISRVTAPEPPTPRWNKRFQSPFLSGQLLKVSDLTLSSHPHQTQTRHYLLCSLFIAALWLLVCNEMTAHCSRR